MHRRFPALAFAALGVLSNGCSNAAPRGTKSASGTTIALPAAALGDFTGTLMKAEGGVPKKAFANVTARVSASGKNYAVEFIGGTPAVSADITPIGNLIFTERPGPPGVYHSAARDSSMDGVVISTSLKPNLNIEWPFSAGTLIFVGAK